MKSSSRSLSFKSSAKKKKKKKKKKKNEMMLSTSESKSSPSTSTDGVVYMRSYSLGTGSFNVPASLASFSIGEEDDDTTTEQHIRLRDERDDVEELSSSYENHITRTAVTPPLIMRPSDESEREEVLKVSS